MKTNIYYFSGTGNSLTIARSICKKLEDCELIPIVKEMEKKNLKSTTEKVGFIFPLYYAGLPKIVYDFVEKIDLSESNYFFTVIASAGGTIKFSFQQLEKILNSKAQKLHLGFIIAMPTNYIIAYETHSEEQQKMRFEYASKQVEVISEMIKNGEENIDKEILEKDFTRADRFNTKFRERVNESDKSFYVDNNCNSCGMCEEICPTNNIIMIEGKPKWQHKCQQCLACINYCPERSIQFGTETEKMGRYHHPEIKVQDIKAQKN
ncbi:MAG: EFR1 family ferrodoxin [Candidatus Thorarchaeota archaeon]